MKNFKIAYLWFVIKPICMYYVVYNLFFRVAYVFLSGAHSALFCLGISATITLALMQNEYRKAFIVRPKKQVDSSTLLYEALAILGIIACGIGLNILMTNMSFTSESTSFAAASATLSSGTLLTKILVTCMVIPALEEIVYRGLVCGQLMVVTKNTYAILISAVCFGIMHSNAVQAIYAILMGLLLGLLYSKTKKLWNVILAHALVNLIVVLYSYIPQLI